MDSYRTEEEQLEALRRWWDENGRSIVAAIVIALAAGFGWQSWKAYDQQQSEQASDIYQAFLRAVGNPAEPARPAEAAILAEQLKGEFSGSTYAEFAALHLAAIAVQGGDLAEAEAQLRWVLGKASGGSDTARVAQLRLARVLAATGDTDQALTILAEAGAGPYSASYAAARGDILLAAGRDDEAREAYNQALALAGPAQTGVNLPALQQKLQSLMPMPVREVAQPSGEEVAVPDAPPVAEEPVDGREG